MNTLNDFKRLLESADRDYTTAYFKTNNRLIYHAIGTECPSVTGKELGGFVLLVKEMHTDATAITRVAYYSNHGELRELVFSYMDIGTLFYHCEKTGDDGVFHLEVFVEDKIRFLEILGRMKQELPSRFESDLDTILSILSTSARRVVIDVKRNGRNITYVAFEKVRIDEPKLVYRLTISTRKGTKAVLNKLWSAQYKEFKATVDTLELPCVGNPVSLLEHWAKGGS